MDRVPCSLYGADMTDTPETPAAKRRRLRLITFAELIGVAALAISAASYWDSHRDRDRVAAVAPAPLLLAATPDGERATLALRPARGDAVVQTQTLSFPASVRSDVIDSTGDGRIEAGWIDDGIRKAVPSARDARPPRLPVGIVTTFVDNGVTRQDAAVYDVGYAMHDRLLRGRAVELEGVTLVRRVPAARLQAAIDQRWAAATKG